MNWRAQFQARSLAVRRRLNRLIGRTVDPYPPLPEGMAFSPSQAVAPLVAEAPLVMAWSRAGIADAGAWQAKARAKLAELTGYAPGTPKVIGETDLGLRDGFRHRAVVLRAGPGHDLPLRLIWRTEQPPDRAMICLQGTNSGMHLSWGEARLPADPLKIAIGHDFARQAAERGYLAVCLEQIGFGERRERQMKSRSDDSLTGAANLRLLVGQTLLGCRAADVSTVASWLLASGRRPIHVMGNSAGGSTALFAAALDERIAGLIASGCVGQIRATLVNRPEGSQNIVPGLLNWLELDDVLALVAPRPALVVSGRHDHIWPFDGAARTVAGAKPVYAALGAESRLAAVEGPGDHRFYPDFAWPAFEGLFTAR